MIRLFLLLLYLLLYFILGLPVLFFLWLVGIKHPLIKDKWSHAIVQWAFRCLLFLSGTKLTVKGLENIPSDQAVLFVANHRSYFDVVISFTLISNLTGFISKIEVKKVPILRLWMKNIHCLFLDRKDIRQGLQTILSGIEKIKSGISIFIFPEGTRNKVKDTFLSFKGGSFKIAEKAGCYIIPISINNSGEVFEDHFPKIKKAHVVIEFGSPIKTAELSKEEKKSLAEIARNQIISMYEKNKYLV